MDTTIRRPRRNRSRPGVDRLEARSLLTASGSLDPTFNSGVGYSTLPISSDAIGTYVSGYQPAEAVQADGDVVVVGSGTADGTGQTTFLITRFNADGTLDTTFGTGGIAQYPAGTTTPAADQLGGVTSALLQPDGKIVLVGSSVGSSTGSAFAAVRLNTDGSIDTTFGTGGTSRMAVGGADGTNHLRRRKSRASLRHRGRQIGPDPIRRLDRPGRQRRRPGVRCRLCRRPAHALGLARRHLRHRRDRHRVRPP